ncbi:MAG TPA: RNA polymerase factor sigma-32 [Candidatus Binatia bacterium]|nr:RNA polymerase factor sigma-32 [Candidatus Binatia bacterium]
MKTGSRKRREPRPRGRAREAEPARGADGATPVDTEAEAAEREPSDDELDDEIELGEVADDAAAASGDDAEAGDRAREGEGRALVDPRAAGDRSAGALVPADSLQRYLAEIRRYPLLDPEEEIRLAIRWREEGDRAAAARLATSNLRLVVMIARQYQQAFKNLLDLVQEGNLGLLEAVKNFDPYRGVRFPSYAVWWIRAYIIRHVMNNWRLVKLGTTQAQRKLFFNLQREKDRLEREGFRPDPALIADRLAVKPSEVVDMEQRLSGRDVSVDAPMGPEGDASMLDFLPDRRSEPEARYGEAEVRDIVGQKIREFGETLRDKEKLIFERRMIAEDPLTLQEIGEKYGVSRERVRQIEERIKRRLRDFLVREVPDISDVDVRLGLGTSS